MLNSSLQRSLPGLVKQSNPVVLGNLAIPHSNQCRPVLGRSLSDAPLAADLVPISTPSRLMSHSLAAGHVSSAH